MDRQTELELRRAREQAAQALEQQTATEEILRVISSSPADLQPVFRTILSNASRLCQASVGAVFMFDGEMLTSVAQRNASPEFAAIMRRAPRRPSRETPTRRCALERRTVHTADVMNDPDYAPPDYQRRENLRAALAVPMRRDDRLIGVITLWRHLTTPFSDRQIALLETFASQAVIAIENVRLFNETREALQQQQALAEVLGAMSASIADTQLVFDRILDSCERLFQGHLVGLTFAGDDGLVRLVAYKGEHQESMRQVYPFPLARDSGSGQAILDQKVIHIPDVDAPDTPKHVVRGAQAAGVKSVIFVPMIDEGRSVGALWVGRRQPIAFNERAMALLRTFADQAVIAIRNSRQFDEIQEKSRQLEVASRHKSEFLANMSHELRTPLNAIIGFTRIVMRRTREQIEARQYENLGKILASGQHLLTLINSILDLAKVEAGRVEIHPVEMDLCQVLESCVRTIEPLIRPGVELNRAFGPVLPPLFADEEKLRQIVINLLSNAAKFTAQGSIRLRAQALNNALVIDVTDSGIGIAPDKLEVIFEEFAQANASNARIYGGTGLGLTIARRLARLMGGEIIAESALGDGSKFTLKLPFRYHTPNV